MNGDGALTWREVVSEHCAALVDELAARLDSELDKARAETAARTEAQTRAEEKAHAAAVLEQVRREGEKAQADIERETRLTVLEQARREMEQARLDAERARADVARETRLAVSESLNQAMRRIRLASTEADALGVLLECASAFCRTAVVLRVENNQAQPLSGDEFSFDLDSAPAVANVCRNLDPVVALASESELSAPLFAALSPGALPEERGSFKAYLFPVAVRQNVIAVLAAAGDAVPASLELLGEAAGLKLEALHSEVVSVLTPLANPELIQIASPAVPETPSAERLAWADLSPEDQKLHLQAQRVARVKVAEMRLYHAEELRKGVFDGNIYLALQPQIDLARADFLQNFLSKSRTMVDYLHLEILRSLAHEDDRLLGHDYPGPMV